MKTESKLLVKTFVLDTNVPLYDPFCLNHFQENNVPEDEEFVFNIYLKNDMRLGLIRRNGSWLVAGYRPQIKLMFIKSESRGDIKIEKDEEKMTSKKELASILRKIHKAQDEEAIDTALDRLMKHYVTRDANVDAVKLIQAEAERKRTRLAKGDKAETPESETDAMIDKEVDEQMSNVVEPQMLGVDDERLEEKGDEEFNITSFSNILLAGRCLETVTNGGLETVIDSGGSAHPASSYPRSLGRRTNTAHRAIQRHISCAAWPLRRHSPSSMSCTKNVANISGRDIAPRN